MRFFFRYFAQKHTKKDAFSMLTEKRKEEIESVAEQIRIEHDLHSPAFDLAKFLTEIFCEWPQNLVKQRISPYFLTTGTPNYYEFTTKE